MDTPQTIDCLEWCFGYGGNHLGLKRVIRNLRCIVASEIEAYALANMVAKMEAGVMDPFPVWSDCKTFPCELFRDLVHLFIASYPCTPFSSAGQRKGAEDPRHLWPYVRRAVEIIRPRYCFFENVDGHISLGLREVLTELAMLGYRVENSHGEPTWGVFSAAEVGAPHNRKRVFILAVREGVVQDDALREQVERFDAGGFSPGTLRTGELADNQYRAVRAEHEQPFEECAEELSGGVELENPKGGRGGTIPARPGNERVGTPEPDRSSERVGNSEKQRCDEGRPEQQGRDGLAALVQRGDSGGIEELEHAKGVRTGISPDEIHAQPNGWASRKESGSGRGRGDGQAVACGSGQQGSERREAHEPGTATQGAIAECRPIFWPRFVSGPGEQQHAFEPPRVIGVKRGLGGGVNGRSANVDRLRLLGNGVYPESAAKAFVTLFRRLML